MALWQSNTMALAVEEAGRYVMVYNTILQHCELRRNPDEEHSILVWRPRDLGE